jgi:hypothetical protein
MNTNVSVNVGPSEAVLRVALPAERRFQELWLSLARFRWSSLVLLPADPVGSAAAIARGLADVGSRLSDVPVSAVTVDGLEYTSALAIRDLQRRVLGEQQCGAPDRRVVVHVTATPVEDEPSDAAGPRAYGGEPIVPAPEPGQIVVAIPAVLSVPLGLAVVAEASAVVLCIERGRTQLADVRRTVELVGRDRIGGCFLVG